jgi:hypothetical protein
MTIEDAIKSNPTFVNVPDRVIELAFTSRGVEMTDDYTASELKSMELISADLYLELATVPNYREGELTVQANRDILMLRARNIYLKYNDDKYQELGYTKLDLKITKLG